MPDQSPLRRSQSQPRGFASAWVAVLLVAGALGAEPVQQGRLELVANFNTVSVYAFPGSDTGKLSTAKLEYRPSDQASYRQGHPLIKTGPRRFAGSIFNLQPGQAVEVRVTAGEDVITGETRTRVDKFPSGSGRTLHVSPAGSDGNDGTTDRPFGTIQHAVDQAQPGDTIVLAEGIWFETVRITRSGRPDAYITLRGSGDAADPSIITGGQGIAGPWRRIGEKLFVADEPRPVNTVRQPLGAGRLYHHESLDALQAAPSPLHLGWSQDRQAGKLYVRLAEDVPPQPGEITAGVLKMGLRFERSRYWIVENIRFHQFGRAGNSRGIDITDSGDIVVRNCRFAHMRVGVRLRGPDTRNCLIERDDFHEQSIFVWPWSASKGHDVEGAAVDLRAGPGNVVRRNRISGPFNGIVASSWGRLEDERLNRDLDIHDNVISEIADDPLEPEGACMNVRFWSNRTANTLTGISLAPITVGPVFVLRDRYLDFSGKAVKVGLGSTGPVYLYHVLGWSNQPTSDGVGGTAWGNMHFRNCILRTSRYILEDFEPHTSPASFDYCCLFTSDPERLIKWENVRIGKLDDLPADVFGEHLQFIEPYGQAAKPAPRHLWPSLIDAGITIPGINDDFRGAAPDLGPDEVR